MADSPSVLLYINHVEIGDLMEWSLNTEEVLGGPGKCTVTIQDRTNTLLPEAHQDVKAVIASGPDTGHVLFRGEIIGDDIQLELGLEWRKWHFTCSDYSGQFSERLVGAFDGRTWMDTSGLGIYVNIDPDAPTLRTDKLTIQNWFDKYIRVDGAAINTTDFVGEYLTDFVTITPAYDTLQGGLEKMAAYVAGNLQSWLDPDLKFHWVIIPAWQDLIDEALAGDPDEDLLLLNPSIGPTLLTDLGYAPYEVSDVYDPQETPDKIGFHSLKFGFDGSNMPEQVYVQGGTGYVYNAPPIPAVDETKVVEDAPIPGAEGTYRLYITEDNTKLWHVDGTGYISLTFELADTGGPWPVQFIHVPWNVARHKGGYFWKILSGPHAGLLADDHTNTLNGYGEIRVELVPVGSGEVPDPRIGVGGSGWVGDAVQDKTKRQAYLRAPISTTRQLRDALGGQALYRGQYPTLRGQVQVTGYDGWRVGQLLKITDERLPANLDGKYYVIQRVASGLIKETTLRRYTLDFGDGPSSKYSYRGSKASDVTWPHPVNQVVIDVFDLTPGPNASQVITGRLTNALGQPWRISGKVVEWSLLAKRATGGTVSQGTLTPTVSITDENGVARTTLRTGSLTNIVYYVFASVRAV